MMNSKNSLRIMEGDTPSEYHTEAHYPDSIMQDIANSQKQMLTNRSDNTLRMYKTYWMQFTAYCDHHKVNALPADPIIVNAFLQNINQPVFNEQGKMVKPNASNSKLRLIRAAINFFHGKAGLKSPTTAPAVKELYSAMTSTTERVVTKNSKRALVDEFFDKVVSYFENIKKERSLSPAEMRDQCLLLMGRQGAFRRSELAGVMLEDIELLDDRVLITVNFHKTSQDGSKSMTKILPYDEKHSCYMPLVIWIAFLSKNNIKEGHLFRSLFYNDIVRDYSYNLNQKKQGGFFTGTDVYRTLKKYLKLARVNNTHLYGAHSLRSGYVTQMFFENKRTSEIKKRTGHKSVETVEIYNKS
ncbi:MAG: tyrosine-type recombinase/integrase [Endozoicomonadaceae bacterium]|nr:tyrosine-type recombinase/integrase [Endozoicomonadaceae bacterium]